MVGIESGPFAPGVQCQVRGCGLLLDIGKLHYEWTIT